MERNDPKGGILLLVLKLLGSLMILLAGIGAALCAVHYERTRVRLLDGWIDLILFIRGQIDCYLTPIDEMLRSLDPELLRSCMGRAGCTSLSELLHQGRLYLSPEAYRLLSGFVREIGSSYREEQLRRCDYYLEAVHPLREKIAEEQPVRIRLSVTLGICLSIATAILLW
ncbi:MAG: stage III sporulation protein AB [Clostridia bacterium]|nr:stage III sporulation protein AB [Clostridia bacterium]MBQ5893104.1 stage III sporulation protein AB [Clostridia bacterium]